MEDHVAELAEWLTVAGLPQQVLPQLARDDGQQVRLEFEVLERRAAGLLVLGDEILELGDALVHGLKILDRAEVHRLDLAPEGLEPDGAAVVDESGHAPPCIEAI